jgi:hypothetical protein
MGGDAGSLPDRYQIAAMFAVSEYIFHFFLGGWFHNRLALFLAPFF